MVYQKCSHLHSELPQGTNWYTRDWSEMVGWYNGAYLGATYTRHALREGGGGDCQSELNCTYRHAYSV